MAAITGFGIAWFQLSGDEMTLTTTNDAGVDLGGEMTLKRQK
jgi:hypothetical protein